MSIDSYQCRGVALKRLVVYISLATVLLLCGLCTCLYIIAFALVVDPALHGSEFWAAVLGRVFQDGRGVVFSIACALILISLTVIAIVLHKSEKRGAAQIRK